MVRKSEMYVEEAVKLGITHSVVSRNAIRGREIARGERIKLQETRRIA